MLTDSRQLTILKRLTVQIEAVSVVNGFDFELTGKVFRGKRVFGEEIKAPFVSLLESPKPGASLEAGDDKLQRTTTWDLLVQGWATDDKDAPSDAAYGLKASIEQRLARVAQLTGQGRPAFPDEYLFGGLISTIRIGPGVCYPPPNAEHRAFFYLPVSLDYREDVANPFV